MTVRHCGAFRIASDKRTLSDMIKRQTSAADNAQISADKAPRSSHHDRMQFDPSDPFFSAPAARAAPATRPRRRPPVESASPQSPLNYRPFPSWARLDPKVQDAGTAAFFAAGASLALLDGILRQNPPFAGALRNRLALRAAAASARILRMREDEAALRDAEHLAAAEDPGPAGRLHRLWRSLAAKTPDSTRRRFGEALRLLDLPEPATFRAHRRAAGAGEGPRRSDDPGGAGGGARLSLCPAPEGEVFALWMADLLLALRLGWERPAPLLVTKILDPSLRRGRAGARPRPGRSGLA